MLEVKGLKLGEMQANCYLVFSKETREALIIDPGDEADYIEKIVAELNLIPVKIAATHGHFDHLIAAFELSLAYKIPFLIHRKDLFLLARAGESAKHFSGVKDVVIGKPRAYLKEGDKIKLGNDEIIVMETPGHTPGSVAFYAKKSRLVFAGDTIFAGGSIGRSDFRYSNFEDIKASENRLKSLPKKTIVYSGHGESFRL